VISFVNWQQSKLACFVLEREFFALFQCIVKCVTVCVAECCSVRWNVLQCSELALS